MKPIRAKGQQLQFLDLGASAKAGIRSELTLLDSSATLLGTRNGNNEKCGDSNSIIDISYRFDHLLILIGSTNANSLSNAFMQIDCTLCEMFVCGRHFPFLL